ncbi:MAG: hypothetical protein QNJ81_00905 [Acidimicrobiia bacterium]|nr:hypothetical protein [Acidimicrobiia bacterium]
MESELREEVMAAWLAIVAILTGVVWAIRWSARRSQDIHDYYSDGEDTTTAETLLRTNEMRGNSM